MRLVGIARLTCGIREGHTLSGQPQRHPEPEDAA
jgi:hypothetical protein